MDSSQTDDATLVGEACHIVAQSPDGPRGAASLASERRDKFANLVLLCNVHHKQVDDQVDAFPVERLTQIKADHEEWVRAALCPDQERQHDDEIYADYIDHWAEAVRLAEWTGWASSLLIGSQPSLRLEMRDALDSIQPWLLGRVWPGRYSNLEAALTNFRRVAGDLLRVFGEHSELEDAWMRTSRFYQIDDWDPARYNELARLYDFHVGLVEDLALELTRAANYVCDMFRRDVLQNWRLREGVVLIQSGPYDDFAFRTHRVEYREQERNETPYPGLEAFMEERFSRDVVFGERVEA